MLDLSNQESMSKNAAIAELLQASGLLGDTTPVPEKTKRVSTSSENVELVSASEPQIIELEEKELKSEEETTAKEETNGNPSVHTLSIGWFLCIFYIIFIFLIFLSVNYVFLLQKRLLKCLTDQTPLRLGRF